MVGDNAPAVTSTGSCTAESNASRVSQMPEPLTVELPATVMPLVPLGTAV